MKSPQTLLLGLLLVFISCRGFHGSVRNRKDLCPKIYPWVFVGYRPMSKCCFCKSSRVFDQNNVESMVFQVKKMLECIVKYQTLHLMDVLSSVVKQIIVMLFLCIRTIVLRYVITIKYNIETKKNVNHSYQHIWSDQKFILQYVWLI